MGGEHKCPVCQSTFTRPQHVARHMRSHTGDRPYKCQFCGDQFARSDLLARHVNKCHANEKPLLPPAGARRKGSASTSRATTSKQACDQCVQNSLPCDGANPCGKCSQRKLRCTFVKFHRQTAPVGPGHSPPQTELLPPSASSASRDDFNLGLAPLTVPSMAESLFSDSFMFSPIYSDNAHTQPLSPSEPSDFPSRYRARADLLRRTGDQVNFSPTSAHPFPESRNGWGGATSTWDHTRFDEEKTRRHPQPRQYPPNDISTAYRHSMHGPKSEFEVDLDFSDGSASSIPSSAAGSQVHLPLSTSAQVTGAFNSSDPAFSQHTLMDPSASPYPSHSPFHPSSSFPSATNILHTTAAASAVPPNPNETFDESDFGALSLDDPALLAADTQPFFSDVLGGAPRAPLSDPNATPMPPRPSSGTEGDGDLWRAFMRSTPVGEHPHHHPPSRRASVPALNIGQIGNGNSYHHPSSAHPHEKRPSSLQPPFHQPRYASLAPQTHQPDDLLRYQQAVLARARETETVLRPPPDVRPKPRRSTLDTEHGPGPGPGPGPGFLAISASARRRGSRPGSSGSSASTGTSGSSLVGVSGVEREGERGQGNVRPGVKRGLSSAMQEEPESKSRRRVVGEEGREGRAG